MADVALGANQQHLVALAEPAGAVVAVVGTDRRLQVIGRKAHRGQLHRVGHHLVTAHQATERVDVGDARHGAQCRPDHPIKQASTFGDGHVFRFHGEHEHLAQRCGDRRHAAADAFRQIDEDAVQPFGHLLTRPVDVGAILKIDGHVDQTVLGHRAQHALVGDAQHLHFDRDRNAGLDLFRGHARRFHDHLDLGAGDVGEGIDRQTLEGEPAGGGQQGGSQQHEQPLGERELDQAIEHLIRLRSRRAKQPSARSRC